MIYHFSDPQPGVVFQVQLRLEGETRLASKDIEVVSFEEYGGVWHPSGSTLTPWDGAHLGVEGTPPDGQHSDFHDCVLQRLICSIYCTTQSVSECIPLVTLLLKAIVIQFTVCRIHLSNDNCCVIKSMC